MNEKVEERKKRFALCCDLSFASNLRPTQMTKYATRPKSSSGLSCCSHQIPSPRLTFNTAPYRSQKFHVTKPGARSFLKPRQRLHATRDAPESEELAFYRRLYSYKDDTGHSHQNPPDDDEGGDWADESTLIAMLQEKYVSTLV